MNASPSQYEASKRVGNRYKRILRALDSVIWPPRSLVTGEQVAGPGLIEPEYWGHLLFLYGAKCEQCGEPFEMDFGEGVICAGCLADPPEFARARAALAYNDVSRRIVLRLKHAGDRSGLKTLGRWMAKTMPELLGTADFIAPVPLHHTRLIRRGFNQSLLLAERLAKESRTPLARHWLKRKRATPSQAGKSATGRKRNVQGAFVVPDRFVGRLTGKRVLLVDDVFTTGATANACARALKKTGVEHVDVATLVRVVNSIDPTI